MPLITMRDIDLAFGGQPVLSGASFQVDRGERVGLVGRNGEGKSTLLRLIAGQLVPDAGTVAPERGLRVGLLDQQVPEHLNGPVQAIVGSGRTEPTEEDHPVLRLCSLLEIDPLAEFSALSGGQKRRALLGRALAAEPDLLLLDEPTNHLDLQSIEWLEGFLARFQGSVLFVTHDRTFLQTLATRIVEVDRGALTSWECDYPTYLRRREERWRVEEREWALQDKKLAQEEEWIRQGIKARRTRNEGRVRALQRLRNERAARRERVAQARLGPQAAERSGKKVITARDISFAYDETPVIREFSATIMRGDRIGVIGPNGSGKTTLLRLLLKTLAPQSGSVEHGSRLEIAYFDQHREALDLARSVRHNIADGNDHIVLNGERRHVLSYLQDFLFSSERARQPVEALSGGERNRLLLARLFTRPANVLVLDEPTNDLDAETLELLEARLLEFDGTVLLVSHDRSFLDNLCTSTFVFEGAGVVREHAGGYSDWKRVADRSQSGNQAPAVQKTGPAERVRTSTPGKLTYREKQELAELPARIETLEAEQADLHETLADSGLYRNQPSAVREATARLKVVEREIESAFARWSELGDR